MMFEIYTKEVVIGDKTYKLRPLSGRFVGKFYALMSKLNTATKEDGSMDMSKLDEKIMTDLYDLTLDMFKCSYPKEDVGQLEGFVAQNLFKLIEPLIQVNMNTDTKADV